ncbi:MAG: hypothetical protein H7Y30_01460 [Pyrinomonadaceae bacterium]|nr:hypothetical protein [Pyrinomonadaceae bacterium]
MNHNQQLQAVLLRLAGAVEILAFVAVVMPRSWMEWSHVWLGMGQMPEGAVLMFLIRQASYVYGMHGIMLWVVASDVVRFRPLVIFTGISFLLAGPVFFIIDYVSGMPLWWTVADSVGCAFFGASLLLLSRDNGARGE